MRCRDGYPIQIMLLSSYGNKFLFSSSSLTITYFQALRGNGYRWPSDTFATILFIIKCFLSAQPAEASCSPPYETNLWSYNSDHITSDLQGLSSQSGPMKTTHFSTKRFWIWKMHQKAHEIRFLLNVSRYCPLLGTYHNQILFKTYINKYWVELEILFLTVSSSSGCHF